MTADSRTVWSRVQATAQRFADHDFFATPARLAAQWGFRQDTWTYAECVEIAEGLRRKYQAAGYGPGHRVALLLENRPDHYWHWFALNALGVSVVPVNPDYKADELHYLLQHSEAAAIIVLPTRAAQAAEPAAALGVPVAAFDAAAMPRPRIAAPGGAIDAATEAALLYTSGSTGRPKGCMVSNAYFAGWGEWYMAQGGYISLRPGEERLVQPLPTFHTNAMGNSLQGMIDSGGCQIVLERFSPRTWWQDAADTGATCFHYLGVMPAMLLNMPPGPHDRAHRMRYGLGGGIHPAHHAAFEERFNTILLEGWAMTETAGAAILMDCDEPRDVGRHCIGKPRTDCDYRIVDDADQDVPPGQTGEFIIRAAGPDPRRRFFSGYLKDQAATDAVWKDGWFRTGDIIRLGDNGKLYFVDRKKNIIRRSGENISTVEVEATLAAHPAVDQVGVLAVLDEIRGEEVMAVIAPKTGQAADRALAEAIFAWCNERLAYYKAPGYIAFLDKLPTTSTQKIRKPDLGDLAENPGRHANCFDLRDRKQKTRTAA